MTPRIKLLPLLALLLSAACNVRYSTAAFHLPANGDPERGRAAFLELGCNTCHQVTGVPLPGSGGAVRIVLGGIVDRKMTDAYIVSQLLGPSTPHPRYAGTRMPAFADRMTVRQMIDIVAFLQSRYQLRPLPSETWYQ